MTVLRIAPSRSAAATGTRIPLVTLIVTWRLRRRTRLALSRLDAHLLKDIGLHEGARARETEKPFWTA